VILGLLSFLVMLLKWQKLV